jgi:hypothetical protein
MGSAPVAPHLRGLQYERGGAPLRPTGPLHLGRVQHRTIKILAERMQNVSR